MHLLAVLISLIILLSACRVGRNAISGSTPVDQTASSPVQPQILYIYRDELHYLSSSTPVRRLKLSNAGSALAAITIGDTLFILREQGLEKVALDGSSTALLVRFELPALFGQVSSAADNQEVIYSANVTGPRASFGMGTYIGVWPVYGSGITATLSSDQAWQPLGLGAGRNSLFVLPHGQDPAFNRLLIANLPNGQISSEISVEGYEIASLSPTGDIIVTTAERLNDSNGTYASILNIYYLNGRTATHTMVPLPNQPSHIRQLVWSPDGRFLYFVLLSHDLTYDDPDHPPTSLGLWQLEINSQTLLQLVPANSGRAPFLAVSSDKLWLLVSYEGERTAERLHLSDERLQNLTLPTEAVPSLTDAWASPAIISNNGQWLLIRPQGKDTAWLIDLPKGTSKSLTLPQDALALFWR
jgi:hypothetical protein